MSPAKKPDWRITSILRQGQAVLVGLTAVAGAVVAVIRYLDDREASIIRAFVRHDGVTLLTLLALAVTAGVLMAVRFYRPVSSGRLGLALGCRGVLGGVPLLVLTLLGLGLMVGLFTVRYRVFSQTWFQNRAIAQVGSRKMADATRTCSRYLELYPQRRPGRMLADPICVDILGDFQKVRRLAEYIRQSPVPDLSRPPPDTTFAFSARNEARDLLKWTLVVSPRRWWTRPQNPAHPDSAADRAALLP